MPGSLSLVLAELRRQQNNPYGPTFLASSIPDAISHYLKATEDSQKTWILNMLMLNPARRNALLSWLENEDNQQQMKTFVEANDYLFIHQAILTGDILFIQQVTASIRKYNIRITETSLSYTESEEKKLSLKVNCFASAFTAACQFNNPELFIPDHNHLLRASHFLARAELFKIITHNKNAQLLWHLLNHNKIVGRENMSNLARNPSLRNDANFSECLEFCFYYSQFHDFIISGLDHQSVIRTIPVLLHDSAETSADIQAAQIRGRDRALEQYEKIRKAVTHFINAYINTVTPINVLNDFITDKHHNDQLFYILEHNHEIRDKLLSAHNYFLLRHMIMTQNWNRYYLIIKPYFESNKEHEFTETLTALAYGGGNIVLLKSLFCEFRETKLSDADLTQLLPFLIAVCKKQDFDTFAIFSTHFGGTDSFDQFCFLTSLLHHPLINNNNALLEFIVSYQYELYFLNMDTDLDLLKKLENANEELKIIKAELNQTQAMQARSKAIERCINKYTRSYSENLYLAYQCLLDHKKENFFWPKMDDENPLNYFLNRNDKNVIAALIHNDCALLKLICQHNHLDVFVPYLERDPQQDGYDVLLNNKTVNQHPNLIKHLVKYKYTSLFREARNIEDESQSQTRLLAARSTVDQLLDYYKTANDLNPATQAAWIKGLTLTIKANACFGIPFTASYVTPSPI